MMASSSELGSSLSSTRIGLEHSLEERREKQGGLSAADVLSNVVLAIPKAVNSFATHTICKIDRKILPFIFHENSNKFLKLLLLIPKIILVVVFILPFASLFLLKMATQKLANQYDCNRAQLSKMTIEELLEEEKTLAEKPIHIQCAYYEVRLKKEYEMMSKACKEAGSEDQKLCFEKIGAYRMACFSIKIHDLRLKMSSQDQAITRIEGYSNSSRLYPLDSGNEECFSLDPDGQHENYLAHNFQKAVFSVDGVEEFYQAGVRELTSRLQDRINLRENSLERTSCKKMLKICQDYLNPPSDE